MVNLILISSPLQGLVVSLLLSSESSLKFGKVIIFLEGEGSFPSLPNVEVFYLQNTRGQGQKNICNNLDVVLKKIHSRCRLWVSDLLWPMNNATYSALLKFRMLHKVNFFDEGVVLYWMEKISVLRYFRENLKNAILEHRFGVDLTKVPMKPFYGNHRNGKVFALHPELLNYRRLISPIRVDKDVVIKFDSVIDADIPPSGLSQVAVNKPAALLLSQPHYRVTTDESFRRLVCRITNYLRAIGYDALYVKLHPSEGDNVFREYYGYLGYKKVFQGARAPIEAKLHAISPNTALVSFNSSALLNAKKFGYDGRTISYGLDWVADQYPLQRLTVMKQKSLFIQAGVEIVSDSSSIDNRYDGRIV